MRKILFLSFVFVLLAGIVSSVSAQTDAPKAVLISGDVTAVSTDKIALQTANGAQEFALSDKTVYKRALPENPKTQVDSSFSEISVGDKVVVSVVFGADKKAQPVRTVYLMSKADIASKQTKEQQEWRTRGVSGRITAVNPQTKEITVTTPGLMGAKTTILTPKDDAKFLRYAQDSESFSEAKKSSFNEVAVGDLIRAIGDKSEDGATIKAEKILTGAFQTSVGTVTAINVEKGEVTINNLQTKKDMTIVVGKNSLLKQFPADQAQRMAQMQAMQANGGTMIRPPQGAQQGNQNPQQNPNQTQGGGGNRGGSFDDLFERFPTIAVTDLKVGEMIAVSSTKAVNQDRITAIKLVSGVEPFVKAAQAQMASGGGNRQGQGGVNSSFTIPGLDGGGLP
jgi:hypothetical protein